MYVYIVDSSIKYFVARQQYKGKALLRFYYNSFHIFILCTVSCCSTIQGNAQLHFHGNNGYTNAPQYYVIHTFSILLFVWQGVFIIVFVLHHPAKVLVQGTSET